MRYIFLPLLLLCNGMIQGQSQGKIVVHYDPANASHRFVPSAALGAAFDGHPQGEIDQILKPENLKAMQAVGLKRMSYRLRTELGIEAWHWNAEGSWSDSSAQQGYWTSSATTASEIQLSYGYFLPRRGNSHDQANDDGYSKLDDGDSTTFWKSNPYLDSFYTGETNRLHPQWVIIDFGKEVPVNAIRIQWGNPFALSYTVDYATDIGKEYFDPFQPGLWHSFSHGSVFDQHGENIIQIIDDKPINARFIRITMTGSSYTAPPGATDMRDKLGFTIRELEAGIADKNGKLTDWINHFQSNERQTLMHVSSTDPWHRATDRDTDTEQTGIDRFFSSGISNGLPVMMPIALLYDTPGNMAALVKYLLSKHYPVSELEMGEEPEGQLINPVDYAALYCGVSKLIKELDSGIRLGGPCFAALSPEIADEFTFTERNWTKLFLDYLKTHHQLGSFNFFSFEWYPFDDVCAPTPPQLAKAPQMLETALKDYQQGILPPQTPIYITEYGYSSHSGRAEVDVEGALMYADIVGKFLTLGGDKAFLYGYEPTYLDQYHNCSWGNNMLFVMDENGSIKYRTAAYYGLQMIIKNWLQPADSIMEIYPVTGNIVNRLNQSLVTAYAILRPNEKWSILLVNKNPGRSYRIEIRIANTQTGSESALSVPLHIIQYSKLQYHWKANGSKGHPILSLPPAGQTMTPNSCINLPPYSMTVINE